MDLLLAANNSQRLLLFNFGALRYIDIKLWGVTIRAFVRVRSNSIAKDMNESNLIILVIDCFTNDLGAGHFLIVKSRHHPVVKK